MKEQLANKILSSLYLYLDNRILVDGEAFSTRVDSPLFPLQDSRLNASIKTFSSERKQWVYDSSIMGATIASGVSTPSGFVPFNGSSTIPDFNNGRVLSTVLSPTGTYQCSFSHKHVNLYITDQTEESLIFDTANLSVLTNLISNSGVPPYSYALPAAFCLLINGDGAPLQLGDEDNKFNKFTVRVVTMMDNNFMHDAVHSIAQKTCYKHFALLSGDKTPLDEFGNIKAAFSGSYNYQNIASEAGELAYIERVRSSKLSYGSHETLQRNIKFGFIDFFINYIGTP